MSDIVTIEVLTEFSEASERAKELAAIHREEIFVRRCENGWAVAGPSWIRTYLVGKARDEKLESESYPVDDYTCTLCMGYGHSPTSGTTCPRCGGEGVIRE
jgi:hypothetical protein